MAPIRHLPERLLRQKAAMDPRSIDNERLMRAAIYIVGDIKSPVAVVDG